MEVPALSVFVLLGLGKIQDENTIRCVDRNLSKPQGLKTDEIPGVTRGLLTADVFLLLASLVCCMLFDLALGVKFFS